jgi:hypothetical protein
MGTFTYSQLVESMGATTWGMQLASEVEDLGDNGGEAISR